MYEITHCIAIEENESCKSITDDYVWNIAWCNARGQSCNEKQLLLMQHLLNNETTYYGSLIIIFLTLRMTKEQLSDSVIINFVVQQHHQTENIAE